MNCPDRQRLSDLLSGALPEEQENELAAHLSDCAGCRRRLESLTDPDLVPSDPVLTFLGPSDRPGCLGRFGEYDVIEVLGRGGMGIVLKAHDPKLEREVAVKILPPELAAQDEARARFLREARAAAAVTHDHIVTIHAVDEIDGLPCIVMTYVIGESLESRIEARGPLGVDEIARIGAETARGLAAAHLKNLVHRDVKPANILLERETARVKIADFGLAKAVDDVGLTQTGMIAGTPQYMAPEQALGNAVDHRADLFALGSVLYYACTGGPPFKADTVIAVVRQVCDETPRPIRDANPEIPRWLAAIVERLMAKDPKRRFASADDVASALEAGAGAAAAAEPPRRRSLLPWLAAGAGVLLIVAVLAFLNRGATTPQGAFLVVESAEGYATLAEAARAAPDGAVIEVRGDGPFETAPIALGRKSLVLRAAEGAHPVLTAQKDAPLLSSGARLVLEGLELRRPGGTRGRSMPDASSCVVAVNGSLKAAHCRFEVGTGNGAIAFGGSACELLSCRFDGDLGVLWSPRSNSRLVAENSVFGSRAAILVTVGGAGASGALELVRDTLKVKTGLQFVVVGRRPRASARIRIKARETLFEADAVCIMRRPKAVGRQRNPAPQEARAYLRNLVDWQGENNRYLTRIFAGLVAGGSGNPVVFLQAHADWQQFWGEAKESAPASAAGAKAAEVGPGPAYHAWTRTPAYPDWRR